MTDKELKRLKRSELLEILFYLQKEMETLRQDNENLRKQLESISSANPTTNHTTLSQTDLAQIITAVRETVQQAMHSPVTADAAQTSDAENAAGVSEHEENT